MATSAIAHAWHGLWGMLGSQHVPASTQILSFVLKPRWESHAHRLQMGAGD